MILAYRIFIDSNVLFSASLEPGHFFLQFWTNAKALPVVSAYVINEVERNAIREGHRTRLTELLHRTEVVNGEDVQLPFGIELPAKDRPILAHAIGARARFLVTGDKNHFGRYFNQTFDTSTGQITIIEPAPLVLFLESLE